MVSTSGNSHKQSVKQFLSELAKALLALNGDVVSYIALATLSDSFDLEFLQEHSQSNLMFVDLRLNYLLTLLAKLRMKAANDKTERSQSMAQLVTCAFYRSVSYGQVLALHEKALEEIKFVVEHRTG